MGKINFIVELGFDHD